MIALDGEGSNSTHADQFAKPTPAATSSCSSASSSSSRPAQHTGRLPGLVRRGRDIPGWRLEVSYLLDLRAYLDDLLRNRERVLAAAVRCHRTTMLGMPRVRPSVIEIRREHTA